MRISSLVELGKLRRCIYMFHYSFIQCLINDLLSLKHYVFQVLLCISILFEGPQFAFLFSISNHLGMENS